MTKVTVDAALRAKWHNFDGLLEVCDELGSVIGYFHPVARPVADAEQVPASPIPDDELERCRHQRSGRSLSEILADLDRRA